MEDWEFSSFKDYHGSRSDSLCNKKFAETLLDLDMQKFYETAYNVIPDDDLSMIF